VPKYKIGKARALVARFETGLRAQEKQKAEKDAGGCLYRNRASRQLYKFIPRARRRREDEVDLGSRCKVDCRQRSISVYINAAHVAFKYSFY
jgi:hypothetical protein